MSSNTIRIIGPHIQREFKAAAAITPGHLVEVNSTEGSCAVHSTAGGTVITMFAMENDLTGAGITTAYSTDDRVQCGIFAPGEEVYALLYNGESASVGDFLESQGDGTLRVVDVDASAGAIAIQSIVGVALEAVDMSDSSGADPSGRISIMIM